MGIGPAHFSESPVKFGFHIWDWFSADGVCIYVIWLSPENYLGLYDASSWSKKQEKVSSKSGFCRKMDKKFRKKECHKIVLLLVFYAIVNI